MKGFIKYRQRPCLVVTSLLSIKGTIEWRKLLKAEASSETMLFCSSNQLTVQLKCVHVKYTDKSLKVV